MELSLYDRVGGSAAIHAVVEILYLKILADESLEQLFNDIELEEQKRKHRSFLAMAFGGPDVCDGKELSDARSHLKILNGLDDGQFESVVSHLQAVVVELNVPVDLAQEILEIVGGARDGALSRSSADKAA